MGWQTQIIPGFIITSGVVSVAVGLLSFRQRPDPMAWPVGLLLVLVAVWSVGDAFSMQSSNLDWMLHWSKVAQIGAVFAPICYFVIAVRYAGYERWFSLPRYAVLCILPGLSLPAVFLYPARTVYWNGHTVERFAGFQVLITHNGVLGWTVLVFLYLLTGLTLVLLASVALRAGTIHRQESLLMFVAGLVPLAANAAATFGLSPGGEVDLTTIGLAVTGVSFATIVFRDDFLNLSPAAYRNVSSIFGDGVLVFDHEKRLVDSNRHARQILDTRTEPGMSAEEFFDQPVDQLDGTIIENTAGPREFYSVRYSELYNYRNTVVGHAVVMRDVTALKEHEQRLSVTNRILRHNLRNELTVMFGHLDSIQEQLENQDAASNVKDAAKRLLEVSEKARGIQSSMRLDPEVQTAVELLGVIESITTQCREKYPDASITVTGPETARVLANGKGDIEIIFENLIENAIEHNDSEKPAVEIQIQVKETVTVEVIDNGPGIPQTEKNVLEETMETDLEHGSGLGLWLVYWSVSAVGGEISFDLLPSGGTRVTVQLQRPPGDSAVASPASATESAHSD